jgi:hypothetical protein
MKLNLNLLFSNKAAAQQGAAAEPPFVTSVAPTQCYGFERLVRLAQEEIKCYYSVCLKPEWCNTRANAPTAHRLVR